MATGKRVVAPPLAGRPPWRPRDGCALFGKVYPKYHRATCSSVFSAFLGIRSQMSVHTPWRALSASSPSAGRILMRPKIAVNQLDQLSPEEQLLVKCAAVIGHSFHTALLQHLLPSWDKNKLCQDLTE
ncbi:Adenylate Cyclase Type 10 [Manis pentadactyla]|nr:Adenylate Cyclase Type 10 [Manis pentadactyla]